MKEACFELKPMMITKSFGNIPNPFHYDNKKIGILEEVAMGNDYSIRTQIKVLKRFDRISSS
jgi:hypothetical protein